MISPREIIQKKRDRQRLSSQEIEAFIRAYMCSEVADYHVAAWLMAVYLNGMDIQETLALTQVMRDSGKSLNLSAIRTKKIDRLITTIRLFDGSMDGSFSGVIRLLRSSNLNRIRTECYQ